jgi:OFA family oxalate/formate antiporter-like MFS transporter
MVTLAAAAVAMFLLGSIYAYGVLLPALMTAFGWERSTAALPHAVLLFVYAVGMGIGGILEHRLSPTGGAAAGGFLFGGGLVLASRLDSLAALVLAYGVLAGIGFGFAYVASVTAAMRSYPHRRGLAAGVVVGAFGLGAFVWAPLAQRFLPSLGWDGILLRFGIAALVLIPLLALGIRAPKLTAEEKKTHLHARGLTLAQALRSPIFRLIFTAYMLVTAVGLLLLAHIVNFGLGQGIPALQAALLLSAMSVGSGTGRITMGWLSDRVGRLPCLVIASALEVVLLIGLVVAPAPAVIFIIAGLAGFAFGTWLTLYGPTATDLFGLRYAGAIYGVLYFSYGLGGLLGPTLGGALADYFGDYRAAFLAGAVLCALATLLFLYVLYLHPRYYAHPPALHEEFPE